MKLTDAVWFFGAGLFFAAMWGLIVSGGNFRRAIVPGVIFAVLISLFRWLAKPAKKSKN